MRKIKLIAIMLILIFLYSSLGSGIMIINRQPSLIKSSDSSWNRVFGGIEIDQSFGVVEISDGYIVG